MTKDQCVEIAIYSAELVLHIFEKEYPNDDRPRKAIEAAREYLKLKTSAAAYAADAAYAAYAAYAADSAYAASAAARVADAAARAASYAASYAARAAKEIQIKIIKEAVRILEVIK